ncbi:hypothetical protein [Mycobacterium sp. URHD0025]|uniref:hypothetical protein n=1 Tax=Mycobacterium sp. URHD0025 TaxID=1298864 RepID=UPI0018CB064A|nr:hypothetical protein [Mycobacterium sp. URHD0025]
MNNDAHGNQGIVYLSLQCLRWWPPLRKPAELQRTALTPSVACRPGNRRQATTSTRYAA